MKCEELMVGDWVRVIPYKKNGRIYRIDDTYGKGNEYVGVIDGDFDIGLLEPIPLTPEILEKNGFVKQGFPGWEIYTEDFLILWRNDYPDVLEIRSLNAAYGSFRRSHISYVHELQHALRLCRINKTIEL